MINDLMKIISNQQAQRLTLKGKTIKYNNLAITLNNSNWLVYSGSGTFANNRLSVANAVGRDGFRIRDSSIFLNLVNGHKYLKRFWLKNSVVIQFYCVNPNTYNADNNGRYISEIEEYTRTDNADKNCDLFPYTNGEIGNIEFGDFIVIDLTLLFGANNEPSTLAEFYATDLGKAIQSGYYPPYTTENKIVSITSPFTFKREIEYNNQINLQDKAEETLSNIGSVKASCKNGIITINGQANSYDYQDYQIAYYENAPLKANHKYFIESKVFSGTGRPFNIVINEPYREVGGSNVSEMIWTCTNPQYLIFRIRGENVNYQNYVVAPIIIDLTEEYGSGNEPTTFEQVKKGWTYNNYFFNNLVYTRTKKVDLGTLTWNIQNEIFVTNISDIKVETTRYNKSNIKCGKYETQAVDYRDSVLNKKIAQIINSTQVGIRDTDYTNATTFKNSLNGVILEYETAEPLELNGINDVVDTFENHSGKVVRKIAKVTFNDIANRVQYDSSTNIFKITITTLGYLPDNALCKEYRWVNSSSDAQDKCMYKEGSRIFLLDSRYTSVNAFIQAQGNTEIFLKRATPTTETERSVLIDHRYTKVVDANEIEIDTD